MIRIDLAGNAETSFAEQELIGNGIRGKFATKVILEKNLGAMLHDPFKHHAQANAILGVASDQIYLLDSGGFRALATRYPLMGVQTDFRELPLDGSILLGVDYLRDIRNETGELWPMTRAVIVYHEVAHLFLFKAGIKGTRERLESFADMLAGFVLAQKYPDGENAYGTPVNVDNIRSIFAHQIVTGQQDQFHGTPEQRAERVIQGFNIGLHSSDLDKALKNMDISSS